MVSTEEPLSKTIHAEIKGVLATRFDRIKAALGIQNDALQMLLFSHALLFVRTFILINHLCILEGDDIVP